MGWGFAQRWAFGDRRSSLTEARMDLLEQDARVTIRKVGYSNLFWSGVGC